MDKERRLNFRYPLQLNARFEATEVHGPVIGVGNTVNVSSKGLLMNCNSEIRDGDLITVAIE